MKTFFNKICEKIKKLPIWTLVVSFFISVFIIVSTIILVVLFKEQTVLHYLAYVLAFISLVWLVFFCIIVFPKAKNKIKQAMYKNKYTNKFITNYGFRVFIFAIFSFVINVGYSGFMGVLAIVSKSPWLGAFSVYYLILSLMRGSVLWSKKKRVENEENTYLGIAISLLVLTLFTAVIVSITYKFSVVSRYEGLLIYAVAAYPFYKLGLSIYNIIKAKKQESMLVEAVKDISFVDALISIFVLQVAMIQVFSINNSNQIVVLNGVTGLLICLGIVFVSVFMIIKVIKVKKAKNSIQDNKKSE